MYSNLLSSLPGDVTSVTDTTIGVNDIEVLTKLYTTYPTYPVPQINGWNPFCKGSKEKKMVTTYPCQVLTDN